MRTFGTILVALCALCSGIGHRHSTRGLRDAGAARPPLAGHNGNVVRSSVTADGCERMTDPSNSGKPASFEKNLERLDAIVRQLEDADLPLEKALQLYEEGMKLSQVCHKQLEEAEGRVEILRKKAGGQLVAEPFEPEKTATGEE